MLEAGPRTQNSLPPIWDTLGTYTLGVGTDLNKSRRGGAIFPLQVGGEGLTPQIHLLGFPLIQPTSGHVA